MTYVPEARAKEYSPPQQDREFFNIRQEFELLKEFIITALPFKAVMLIADGNGWTGAPANQNLNTNDPIIINTYNVAPSGVVRQSQGVYRITLDTADIQGVPILEFFYPVLSLIVPVENFSDANTVEHRAFFINSDAVAGWLDVQVEEGNQTGGSAINWNLYDLRGTDGLATPPSGAGTAFVDRLWLSGYFSLRSEPGSVVNETSMRDNFNQIARALIG